MLLSSLAFHDLARFLYIGFDGGNDAHFQVIAGQG